MKLNTNSNTYTIVYSAIIVVVVAFLLAFVYQVLKPKQDANEALDQKKQVLYALNIRGLNDTEAAQKYKEVVLADQILDRDCNVVEQGEQGGENAGFKLKKADQAEGKLALYICKVDGQTKYVIPVYGMGLWGGISGYLGIKDDGTVYGAYFNHEGETAGLGAEIKDSQAWQEKFQGKKIFDADGNVVLSVVKKVENPETQVDCVTGATLTSNGVDAMLKDGLKKFFKPTVDTPEEVAANAETESVNSTANEE